LRTNSYSAKITQTVDGLEGAFTLNHYALAQPYIKILQPFDSLVRSSSWTPLFAQIYLQVYTNIPTRITGTMTKPVIRITTLIASISALFLLTACEPEMGTPEWCKMIKEKGVENVTAKETANFAKNCVL
jgi:hypothetical protein|tara:strand:+ start:158 stop:547 length:390 start_codon:yes stop_codon:yes gene_type:complete